MPGFQILVPPGCDPPGPEHTTISRSHFADPNIESARKNRYLITIFEPLRDVLVYAYRCTRPTAETDVIPIHNGQDQIWRPGKDRWKPVEFTFYEVLTSDNTKNHVADLLYAWRTAVILPHQSQHGELADYLRPVDLELLNGVGAAVWIYHMYDCWPSLITPSNLSYVEGDIADVTVTLQINKAVEGVT